MAGWDPPRIWATLGFLCPGRLHHARRPGPPGAQVRCIRGGKERQMSVFDLLVGDLVLVEAGDILPVDGVLVEGSDIK